MTTQPTFDRDPVEWLDPDIGGPKNPIDLLDNYLRSYTGGRFEITADATQPNAITPTDLVAVSMLSVDVPPRLAAWLLDPTGARIVTDLLTRIDSVPIWEQPEEVITDPAGPLTRLWSLLRAPSTQLPAIGDDNGVGPVIAGKLLAAKRPHLVPIYDRVVAGALGAPTGAWWRCWRTSMSNQLLREYVETIRSAVAPAQPMALALSDLRLCDIVVWMAEHGAAGAE
jgi:hypothetical protein